jgi:hypothetical protein
LEGKIKTIYNTPDVNYKFISFPKNYNLIVHPLYPLQTNLNQINKNNLNQNQENKDIFILFSKFEILLFFIFLFIFIILIVIYILSKHN